MTPEERAAEFRQEIDEIGFETYDYDPKADGQSLVDGIAEAIREAVAAERATLAHWIKHDFNEYDEEQHPDVVCDLIHDAIMKRLGDEGWLFKSTIDNPDNYEPDK